MYAYVIRRLLLIIPTLFLASLIVFFLIRLIPGDIIQLMVGEHQSTSNMDRDAIEKALGLDVPMQEQYARWVGDIILHGSLSESLWKKVPVTELILQRLPVTIELGALALVIAILVAIPIGIYSAIRQDTLGDFLGRTVSILAMSVPGFWIGTAIMVYPALWWGWSPPVQLIRFSEDAGGHLTMFIIPAAVMGLAMSGTTMRMTRTMMLEVLRQDYIKTAWSKGMKERTIVIRHALKNALIPVVTIIGLQMPVLIGGAVIIEQIFSLPGVGRLMLDAISARDYPIISGVMLVLASFVLILNMAVDLTYSFLDPRIHYR
ncbi:MAG: ABC transporter permease [Dehalococcoidia bacterium]|nr:ABC transporter permease [Dehalococcoidia bacterium]